MPLLRAEAEKLSNSLLEAGVIEELITRDETFAFLPFMGINNKTYDYVREDETDMTSQIEGTDSVKFTDPDDVIPERATKFIEVSAKLRALIGDVDVDNFLNETMADTNSQKATQIAAKAKVIRSKWQRNFAIGSTVDDAKSFDGLPRLVASAQTISAGPNGAALDFDMLDELKDMITYGADALIMHRKTWRAMKTLMRALNIQPEHLAMPELGLMVPVYDGTPILRNDYLPVNEVKGGSGATTTSIYAARFNEEDGLFGLYGGPNMGVRVEDIGTVQNKDATRTRVKWYSSVGLKSTKSLARLDGIILS
jgi:hypothetical protein